MKKLVLHVGAPKCGSSALQSSLFNAEESGELGELGFVYPKSGSRGLGHGNSGPVFDEFHQFNKSGGLLNDSLSFLEKVSEASVVISDEVLFGVTGPNQLNALANHLGGWAIDVVVAVRDPASWLVSDYYQHIKQNLSGDDFIKHVARRERWCDWPLYFSRFSSVPDNVSIIGADYMRLFDVVEELIGAQPGFLASVKGKKNENRSSLSDAEFEVRRVLNNLGGESHARRDVLLSEYDGFDLKCQYSSLFGYLREKFAGYEKDLEQLSCLRYIGS